jgi:hypothetical protein
LNDGIDAPGFCGTSNNARFIMRFNSINELVEQLEGMSHQQLTKFTKQWICQKLYSSTEPGEAHLDPGTVLDMVHSEYLRRGLEKHYDMTYESVTKNPGICDAA